MSVTNRLLVYVLLLAPMLFHAGCKMSSTHLTFFILSLMVAIAMSEQDLIQDILEKMKDAGAR